MKKILMSALFSVSILFAAAQSTSYTPYQINGTIGYAATSGAGTKAGIVIVAEPQFHYSDNLSFGFKSAFALTAKATLDASGNVVGDFSIAGISSYQATGSYYFQRVTVAKFRPWAGVGLGFARAAGAVANTTTTVNPDDFATKSGFSGSARVGFDVSHFRLNLDYNINPKTGRITNNYFGVNLGFYFGGGAKVNNK